MSVSVAFFIIAGEMDAASGLVGVLAATELPSGAQGGVDTVEPSTGRFGNCVTSWLSLLAFFNS